MYVVHRYNGKTMFQFLMVRLKDEARQRKPHCAEFQFLMVRLKEVLSLSILPLPKFQFLMVRLKVPRARSLVGCWRVSIPYGTIKRSSVPGIVLLWFHVSIPYGTIKRLHAQLFCMFADIVSIPYGTIKRPASIRVTSHRTSFNSLWYD